MCDMAAVAASVHETTCKGGLAPDALVIDALRGRIGEEDCERGFVLDGFPRTRTQCEQVIYLVASVKMKAPFTYSYIIMICC